MGGKRDVANKLQAHSCILDDENLHCPHHVFFELVRGGSQEWSDEESEKDESERLE